MTTTILVVDDSEDDQRLYQRAFKDFDCFFSLVMTSSAEAGFARLADLKPDLILLDYNLPDMDGLSFMKKLAEYSDTPIPIIMLTGESNAAVAVEAMKNGVDDYIVKDTDGRYLRLLPGVAGHVMAAHAQREQARRLQKQTEALLLRNQILMQSSMDGIHVMDMLGNLVEANDAFCRMLGYTREEMAHFNVADWDAHWSAEELQERFKQLIGKSAMFETVHRRKDGSLIDVEVSSSGMEIDGQGFLFAASRDITGRKQAEGVLKLNKTIIETSYDGFWRFDTNGYLLEVNQSYADMTGYTREELVGKNISQISAQSITPELVKARIDKAIGHGLSIFETQHRHKDGHVIDVDVSIAYIPEAQCLFSFMRDITERKKIEAVLEQHKLVLDTSIDGFWMTDMQGYLLEANEAYAKLSGYSVAELVNMHISQLEAIELKPEEVRVHIEKVVAQGYDRFETRHRHKDGHEIEIEVSVNYMADTQRLVVFCRDITERKKAEATLLKGEANLRAMLDNSPYLTWLKDTEGRYIAINTVFADYLRLEDIRDAIGKTDLDLQPKALAEKYRADDAEVMASRQRKHVEESAFDGHTTHWVETYKTPIIDGHGNLLGTVGFAKDITERKRSEERLRESETNLKDMFENLRSGVAVYRALPDGQDFFFTSFNRAAERIENVRREDVIGKNVVEVFPGVVEFGLLEIFRRVWQSGVEEHFPITFYQDGRIAGWRENHIYKLPNGEIVAIYDDVTKEKQAAEEMFLESQVERKRADMLAQQFGHLLQNSFNEIYLFDADSLKFLLTSEGAEKNLGYTDEELNQLTPLDLKPSYTRESFEELIAPLRSGKQPSLLFDASHRRKDGTTYPVEIRLQLMESDSPMFLAVIQDISERKKAEQNEKQFTRALKLLSECNTLLIHAENEQLLLENICQLAVVTGGYLMAWVGFAENDAARTVRPIALSGYEEGYLDGIKVTWSDTEFGQGPTGTAIRTGATVAIMNCLGNPKMAPWREVAIKRGYQSSIALPLVSNKHLFGALTIYSVEPQAFGDEEVVLLEELASNLAFGIETLRIRGAHERAQQESRELSKHLQTVREEEKASFSREIHDDLGGILAALKMDAYWLASNLAAEKDLKPLLECTKSMSGLLDTAVLSMRRIITDLRPTLLDDLGLVAALKWQSAEFQKRSGIESRVFCVEDSYIEDKLSEAQLINLFRIAQEALTNVARHSGASRVEVGLHQDGEEVVLTISDNGKGLPQGNAVAPTSYGMRGMRERVILLGGKINFDSPPDGGFSVAVRLPLPADNKNIEGVKP